EALVAGILATAGQKTVDKLIKQAAADLDRSVLEREEAAMLQNLSVQFKCKRPTGYVWELTTDAVGHAFLKRLADDLNNPRTASGRLPFPAGPGLPTDTPDG